MTSRSTVLQLVTSLGPGGYERVVCNLARDIDASQYRMAVCCLKHIGYFGMQLAEEGAEIHALRPEKFFLDKYFALRSVRRLVCREHVDLVHTHGRFAFLEGVLVRLAVPRIRLVHTFHYGDYPNLPRRSLAMEAICCRFADQLVAVSENQRQRLLQTFHLAPKRVCTVWNGVSESVADRTPAAIKRELGIPVEATVVGTIGHLIEQKGHVYLLQCCRQLRDRYPDVYFVVVGHGALESLLRSEAQRLQVDDRVRFTGGRLDATTVLGAYDIFLMTSLWEAMPIVLLEAMAAAKPIIATDVGENSRIVTEGETGFIVEPKAVDQMVARLEVLLTDRRLRDAMGARGREKFQRLFSARTMARNYEDVYGALLARHRRNRRPAPVHHFLTAKP